MRIDRDVAVPLYEQLASELRQQIETGKLKPGAALSPESGFVAKFRVSRITVRKALDLLVDDGLIVRRQGKGTFVAQPKIRQDLHTLRGFAEVMAERGRTQVMQVVEFGIVRADTRVARALGVAVGDGVLRINRLHLLSDDPIAFAIIYIPAALGSSFAFDEVSTTPIYTLLAQKAHVEVKRATQVVRAIAADVATAKALALPKSAPVMMVERVTYSTEEKPVEFILFSYRGDRYELAMELFRDPKQNVFRPIDSVAGLLHES
jgi:GntR family transcriptional regulator